MKPEEIYDRAWAHFEMIAKQRLTTFNFYLVILGASVAAFIALYERETTRHIWSLFTVCNMLIPALFFIMDQREISLMRLIKKTMMAVESDSGWPEFFRPFSEDDIRTNGFSRKVFSYTGVFRVTFSVHLFFAVYLLLCPISPSFPNQDEPTVQQPKETTIGPLPNR